mgnify:CR=1 FL=1
MSARREAAPGSRRKTVARPQCRVGAVLLRGQMHTVDLDRIAALAELLVQRGASAFLVEQLAAIFAGGIGQLIGLIDHCAAGFEHLLQHLLGNGSRDRAVGDERQQFAARHQDRDVAGVHIVGRADRIAGIALRAEARREEFVRRHFKRPLLGGDIAAGVGRLAVRDIDALDHAVAVEPVRGVGFAVLEVRWAVPVERAGETGRRLAGDEAHRAGAEARSRGGLIADMPVRHCRFGMDARREGEGCAGHQAGMKEKAAVEVHGTVSCARD